jgi:hypothetical protein
MERKNQNMRSLTAHLALSSGLLYLFVAPAHAAPNVPTCEAVGRAVADAHGPIGSVEDHTARVNELKGQTPFPVLRSCYVHVPGLKFPLNAVFYGNMDRHVIEGFARLATEHGMSSQKLDGAAYGDLAYLSPQIGGGYSVQATVKGVGLAFLSSTEAEDTKNMVAQIVKLM